jgi:hypothetical protein
MAIRLMDRLVENTTELHHNYNYSRPGLYADFEISPTERLLIRLGALLHDVSHVPFSHDLERQSHKIFYGPSKDSALALKSWYGHYAKHDDYSENPLLFRLICDQRSSELARVLEHYSGEFWTQLQSDAQKKRHEHLKPFVEAVKSTEENDWKPDKNLLPDLLFHLLTYERPEDAAEAERAVATTFAGNGQVEKWHLGPKSLSEEEIARWHNSWYQPFRHDIIGNTLSSDLIDYLTRDPQRLGTPRRVDLHLLSYYVLVNPEPTATNKRFRCAIDLHDYKRGTTRTFLLNDIFRLLDLRQDIHEKAVMHRVVQCATAMLGRGLLLLGNKDLSIRDRRPPLSAIAGLEKRQQHALQSEDTLFQLLLDTCNQVDDATKDEIRRLNDAHRLFEKLIERRIFRPLVIVPGNWAKTAFHFNVPKNLANTSKEGDFKLRTLAAIVDSAYYSPFLLFVCSCVEKYLTGIFDTDVDVCRYAEEIVNLDSPDKLLQQALALVPSRVITWAAPYKQLYKDPAIVVALDGFVDQIDHVTGDTDMPDESTRTRIEAAIQDADSKYEGLWQLYVFISDGLYYSGILNKLLTALPPTIVQNQTRDKHKARLEHSQAFLALAFKAICNNWAGQDQQLGEHDAKTTLLHTRMGAEAFKEVLRVWVTLYKEKTGWGKTLTSVDVTQYYHEFSLDANVEDKLRRPCRDTRYKFDKDAMALWEQAATTPNSDGYHLIQFLDACQIRNPMLLSESEFLELIELYKDKDVSRECDALLNQSQRDPTMIPKALKQLWLGGFPWPRKPLAMETRFPISREEIAKWLRQEARILRPNVRRQLCEDLDPIVDILHWATPAHGNEVFEDFKRRLDNEAMLIWNDVRSGHITNALRRRWKHPKATAPTETSDILQLGE